MRVTRESSVDEYASALAEVQGLSVERATLLALRHACRLEGLLDESERAVKLTNKGHEEAQLLQSKPS